LNQICELENEYVSFPVSNAIRKWSKYGFRLQRRRIIDVNDCSNAIKMCFGNFEVGPMVIGDYLELMVVFREIY
jgi:hypothetical protein